MRIYNSNMLRVIADVHAQAIKLEKLIDNALNSENNYQFIFLGDIIGKGQNNLKTMQIICDLVEKGLAEIVIGNYEKAILAWDNGDKYWSHYEIMLKEVKQEVKQAGIEGEELFSRFINILRNSYAWKSEENGRKFSHAIWVEDFVEKHGSSPKYKELNEEGKTCLGVMCTGHLNFSRSEKFEFTKLNWDWVNKLKPGETVYSGHVSVDTITEKKGTLGGTSISLDTLAKTSEIGYIDIILD